MTKPIFWLLLLVEKKRLQVSVPVHIEDTLFSFSFHFKMSHRPAVHLHAMFSFSAQCWSAMRKTGLCNTFQHNNPPSITIYCINIQSMHFSVVLFFLLFVFVALFRKNNSKESEALHYLQHL